MRKYIEEKRSYIKEVLEFAKCDLCGGSTSNPDNWYTQNYGINGCKVRHKEGKNYPGEGWYTETLFDICPHCFKKKIIPWLEKQGAKPTVREVNY